MNESRLLAETIAKTTWQDLPPEVVEYTRRAVLDWLGSALAGSIEWPARIVQDFVSSLGRSEEATVFGAGRSSAAGAALANGAASHILEFDDVHKGSTLHGGAPVISAALAVAERQRASGREFMLAVALGYEAALRVGEAVNNPSHYYFWHPTGTSATFGAAAAAGSLLRLDADRMLDALGTAGTQASGLWEFNADGAMSKHLHPAKAAFNGVLAADLAFGGFTGAARILEGERGYFRATSRTWDADCIARGLGPHHGQTWKISENWYKIYPCCGHTHTAIDLALELRPQVKQAISDIEISLYATGHDIVKEPNPNTAYKAKFSIAFCTATALTEGCVGLDQFSLDRFGPDGVVAGSIRDLLQRTKVRVDNQLTPLYPSAWPARIKIKLEDGSVLEASSSHPRGCPENPVSTDILEEKFLALVEPRFGAQAVERALEAVRKLDRCDDLSGVFSNLTSDTEIRQQ
jgi:2-methylcitrate dehydratase PrpD